MESEHLVKDFVEKDYMELKSNERKCGCGQTDCVYNEEEEEKKGKTFILINNRGMNVDHISSFYYDIARQKICIRKFETFVYECFVPLSEGPFILANLQKALNAGEDFNFHFTRTKENSTFFQRLFCATERLYRVEHD
jgi:hypothetical protein